MKSDLYIKHDIYALDDDKIMDLIFKYHELGYGVFWCSVERLTTESTHRIKLDSLARQVSARLMSQNHEAVIQALEYMVELGLFILEDGVIHSDRVDRQCAKSDEYRASQKSNAQKRWEAVRAKKAENEDSDAVVAKKVLDLYSTICKSLPKVRTMTPQRKVHSRTLVQEYGLETIEEGFKKAEASKFLKEGNGTWNGANFDWLINKQNFAKVLEDIYVDRVRTSTSVCNESSSYASDINSNGGFDL